jgi:hypothetical protein
VSAFSVEEPKLIYNHIAQVKLKASYEKQKKIELPPIVTKTKRNQEEQKTESTVADP